MAIAATLAGARLLPRWAGLHRAEQGLFAVARRMHTERKIALSGDVSALGSSTLVTAIAVSGGVGLALAGRLRDGVTLALVAGLAATIGTWLKRATKRERPDSAEGSTFGSSFPSSHTLMGTAVWLMIGTIASGSAQGWLQAWIWAVAATVPLCVGISRVFLHAHYLSDVVAGWAVGAALAVAGAIWRSG